MKASTAGKQRPGQKLQTPTQPLVHPPVARQRAPSGTGVNRNVPRRRRQAGTNAPPQQPCLGGRVGHVDLTQDCVPVVRQDDACRGTHTSTHTFVAVWICRGRSLGPARRRQTTGTVSAAALYYTRSQRAQRKHWAGKGVPAARCRPLLPFTPARTSVGVEKHLEHGLGAQRGPDDVRHRLRDTHTSCNTHPSAPASGRAHRTRAAASTPSVVHVRTRRHLPWRPGCWRTGPSSRFRAWWWH